MEGDVASNIELKPILIGAIISVVLILLFPMGILHLFWVIIGSAVSGFLAVNSTKYALVYGAIIGIISSFLMLTVFTISIYIILGVFGGFVGKVIKTNFVK